MATANRVLFIPEILEQILLLEFDVLDIIRYRAVCSTWRSLIDNSAALKEYMTTGIPKDTPNNLLYSEENPDIAYLLEVTPAAQSILRLFWKKLLRLFSFANEPYSSVNIIERVDDTLNRIHDLFAIFAENSKCIVTFKPLRSPYRRSATIVRPAIEERASRFAAFSFNEDENKGIFKSMLRPFADKMEETRQQHPLPLVDIMWQSCHSFRFQMWIYLAVKPDFFVMRNPPITLSLWGEVEDSSGHLIGCRSLKYLSRIRVYEPSEFLWVGPML